MMNEEIKEWMEYFKGRFDAIEKFMQVMSGRYNVLDGVRLLDNQDLCQMLNVSKRTLQRYRSLGTLPYQMIYHKIFYREPDVEVFIQTQFNKSDKNREDPDDETQDISSGDEETGNTGGETGHDPAAAPDDSEETDIL